MARRPGLPRYDGKEFRLIQVENPVVDKQISIRMLLSHVSFLLCQGSRLRNK
jgi:hypothetical protein